MLLTRTTSTDFKVNDSRRLSFYASVFGQPTTITEPTRAGGTATYRERIRKGAFTHSLAEGHEVIANINHDENRTFARRSLSELLLQEDGKGLFCSCWVPATPIGDEVIQAVRDGKARGCSFRFEPLVDEDVDGIKERVSVKLIDVCVAIGENPAYPGTEVYVRTQSRAAQLVAQYEYLKFKLKIR